MIHIRRKLVNYAYNLQQYSNIMQNFNAPSNKHSNNIRKKTFHKTIVTCRSAYKADAISGLFNKKTDEFSDVVIRLKVT